MKFSPFRWLKRLLTSLVFLGFVLGIIVTIGLNYGMKKTSTNEFCESCHVHPQATISWKQGPHFDTKSGVAVGCVQCHLPPEGLDYASAKISTGARDVYGMIFKDTDQIDWEAKSTREAAMAHVYKASCVACHQNLFPSGLSKKGEKAHLHFKQKEDELRCINCHLHVGHFNPNAETTTGFETLTSTEFYDAPATIDSFVNFTEFIPGSPVSFEMIAIPGGAFTIGSPENEGLRREDEGPRRKVEISPFWMGKIEVTWDMYNAFIAQTYTGGRTEDQTILRDESADVDAITGPTPAYGDPSQGWGRGQRPAITMTFHAAEMFCKWLSKVTGKKYRLPTEAEWEYGARGGTETPYFFAGSPDDFDTESFWNSIFGADTTGLNKHVIYAGNSRGKTRLPDAVEPNPSGLLNMLGSVREFCSDWYAPGAYAKYSESDAIENPTGPASGEERVVRGGSYKSGVGEIRSAARDHTRHTAWLVTDPQIPKSIWWYSDQTDVGFRVVCEYNQ